MATQQAKKKDRKIPDDFAMFVGERFPDGKYLVCNVCSEYDDELSFCKVWSCGGFWTTSFKDHVRSARHKDNCVKKASFEAVQQRHLENDGARPHKKALTVNIKLLGVRRFNVANLLEDGSASVKLKENILDGTNVCESFQKITIEKVVKYELDWDY